jgi:hypothetical protein
VPDSTAAVPSWRKSSASASGDCVEVAAYSGYVLLRDSKNRCSRTLELTPASWRTFLSDARSGKYDVENMNATPAF